MHLQNKGRVPNHESILYNKYSDVSTMCILHLLQNKESFIRQREKDICPLHGWVCLYKSKFMKMPNLESAPLWSVLQFELGNISKQRSFSAQSGLLHCSFFPCSSPFQLLLPSSSPMAPPSQLFPMAPSSLDPLVASPRLWLLMKTKPPTEI
jgi:hypothetical protein